MSMQKSIINTRLFVSSLVISGLLAGCASTAKPNELDPWEGWNRGTQEFNDDLDKAVLKPLAEGYRWITPKFVNDGITNFFSNMNDIGVTLNDFMQLKMAQGGMDASRFLINTTAGVAGFVDVAQMIDLPKHNEDFGQTLGFWGVPSGNYLVLPFFGASSPREAFGLVGDALMNPLTYTFAVAGGGAVISAVNAGAKTVDVTDTRADLIPTEKVVNEASGEDRYSFIKNAYQQRREYLLHDGNVPEENEPQLEEEAATEDKGTLKTNAPAPATAANSASPTPATAPASTPSSSNSKHFLDISAPDKK